MLATRLGIYVSILFPVPNNKADAKSPPPVIFTASRRQSFSCPKSPVSHIFHQSVTFLYVTDSGDYQQHVINKWILNETTQWH